MTCVAAVAVCFLCALWRPAMAQWLQPATGAGEFGAETEARFRSGVSDDDGPSDRRTRLWLKLPLRGSLGGTRSLLYHGTIRPSSTHATSARDEGAVRVRQFDYEAGLRLQGLPRTALLGSISRGRSTGERGRITFTEGDLRSASANLGLQFAALPITSEYQRRDSRTHWMVSPLSPPLEQREVTDLWSVSAQNSRTALRLARTRFDDRTRSLGYDAWDSGVSHTLRWGKGSRLQSSFRRYDRDGASPYQQSSWEERLRVQHTRRFGSEWLSIRQRLEGTDARVRSDSYGGTLHHRPWSGLEWSLPAGWHDIHSNGVETRSLTLAPRLSWSHGPVYGFRLRSDVQGTIEHRESFGPSPRSALRLRERHLVGANRIVQLELQLVDTTSIRVRGAFTLTEYTAGADYLVLARGARVEILTLVTGRIAVGQTLEVDYRYSADPSRSADWRGLRYEASLEFSHLLLRHVASTREVRTDDAMLLLASRDERESTTELEWRQSARMGTVTATLRRSTRATAHADDGASEANIGLTFAPRRGLDGSVDAGVSERSGTSGSLRIQSITARAGWTSADWGRVGAALWSQMLERSAAPAEQVTECAVSYDVQVGSLESRFDYRRQSRSPQARGRMQALAVRITRRF